MPKISVTSIDLKAKGSFREQQKLNKALVDRSEGIALKDIARIVGAQNIINEMAVAHMRTDDGSPLETAIDEISQADFNALVNQFMGVEPPIPPESADSSPKP